MIIKIKDRLGSSNDNDTWWMYDKLDRVKFGKLEDYTALVEIRFGGACGTGDTSIPVDDNLGPKYTFIQNTRKLDMISLESYSVYMEYSNRRSFRTYGLNHKEFIKEHFSNNGPMSGTIYDLYNTRLYGQIYVNCEPDLTVIDTSQYIGQLKQLYGQAKDIYNVRIFPLSWISARDANNDERLYLFNTDAYICSDTGKTLEKISGEYNTYTEI